MVWFIKAFLQASHINVSDYIECITSGNMAQHIDDQHFLYYHTDTYQSIMMGHGYFQSPYYLVMQGWIRVMLLYPTNIQLAE